MGTTENVQAWSTTAATNATADAGINWAEGQNANTVNNSARGGMAATKKYSLDIGGNLVAAGTANAITLATNQALSAGHVAAGLELSFRATATNTGAVTLAPDSLTQVAIVDTAERALTGGEIVSGAVVKVRYNANTSHWQLVSGFPTPGMFLLASGLWSAQATGDIVLTTFTRFRALKFVLTGVVPVTDGAILLMRFSTDGGSNYLSASNYQYATNSVNSAGGVANAAGLANSSIQLIGSVGNVSSEGLDIEIDLLNQASAAFFTRCRWSGSYMDTTATSRLNDIRGSGCYAVAEDTDAVRFLFSAGNIASGAYSAFGLL